MLLSSHFDIIPLKQVLTDAINNLINDQKIKGFKPYTENMGLFNYETNLMFVNLTDSWLIMIFVFISYVIIWGLEKVTKSFV